MVLASRVAFLTARPQHLRPDRRHVTLIRGTSSPARFTILNSYQFLEKYC